jgi:curved DNA-binding protein
VKFQDYYQTLGVGRTASADEIKSAYRKLAKEWHPDRHPPHKRAEVEERFKAIAEAHEVLSDPDKRKRYDQLGEHWRHGQDFQPPPGGGFRTVSPEEFARMFGGGGSAGGGGFSDFFAQMFGDFFQQQERSGGRRARGPTAARGEDVEAELELSVGEALRGGKRPFELQVARPCGGCDGTGRTGRRTCPRCGGLGSLRERRTIELSVPKDARDGQVLRLRGLGEPGEGGGTPGDLLLQLRLAADDVYRMRGDDVEADLVVAPWEALDGVTVDVPVPAGTAAVKIPAGTRSGARLRLRGQGLSRPDGGRSDLFLVVRLGLPAELSERQKALLRELAQDAGRVTGGVRR